VKVEFKIQGVQQLDAMLRALGPKTAREVGTTALREAAKPIFDAVKERIPVRTGELRRGLTVSSVRQGKRSDERELLVGFRKNVAWRAKFLEFGTRFIAPQPFMRPGFDVSAEKALGIMVGALGRGITAAALKLGKRGKKP
jgi:HK97 gp10 family phage protein